ncbi:MAG TPA: hypothetical protein VJX74_17025 [Blastocatellia bacterium]|nr:hypothetical protein [Blastocatellia bacterium]
MMRINLLLITALLVCSCVSLAQNDEREIRFTSEYTDLTNGKGCQSDSAAGKKSEGSDSPLVCRGPGGYQVYIGYAAVGAYASVRTASNSFTTQLAAQSADFNEGRKIEWRLADGRPFAVIMRVIKYREKVDDPTEAFSEKNKISEVLIVRGLKGQEHIRFDVDPRKTDSANEEARKLADAGFRRR